MLPFHDQVAHRILIQQCGECGRPKMAVDVLELMRRSYLSINAISYGIYHQSILSGQWPNPASEKAARKWALIRNMLDATIRLRRYRTSEKSDGTAIQGNCYAPAASKTSNSASSNDQAGHFDATVNEWFSEFVFIGEQIAEAHTEE